MIINLKPFRAAEKLSALSCAVGVCFLSSLSYAGLVAPPQTEFSSLQTPSFHILTKEECRAEYKQYEWAKAQDNAALKEAVLDGGPGSTTGAVSNGRSDSLESALLSWIPTGAQTQKNRSDCGSEILQQAMIAAGSEPSLQLTAMQGFFNRCGQSLSRNAPDSLFALIQIAENVYPTCENPNMRKVLIHLQNKTTLRAILALKPGPEKRPLIVVRCGVFCNSGDVSHRFLLMQLFDESPFNVLAINGITGAEYIDDNGYISLGGFDEGHQMIRLGQMIEALPLGKRVSSLHALGISLGGQGALYTAQLNDYNLKKNGQPIYSSVLAISPVVDLKTSMMSLFDAPIKGRLAKWLFFDEFVKVTKYVTGIDKIFPKQDQDEIPRKSIPLAVAGEAVRHYSQIGTNWLMAPFKRTKLETIDQLWDANQFSQLALAPLKTPTLVFAAEDDQVVSTSENSLNLRNLLQPNRDSRLQVLIVPNGNHGAFNVVYGWNTISVLYRSFFLSHSPELFKHLTFAYSAFPESRISSGSHLWKDSETHLYQSFSFTEGRATLAVHFKIYSAFQDQARCQYQDPMNAPVNCYRSATSEIPLSEFSGSTPWAHIPRNATEAQAMTRWANANLVLLGPSGLPVSGTNDVPSAIRWPTYL